MKTIKDLLNMPVGDLKSIVTSKYFILIVLCAIFLY